jgi:hypothetical protein
MDTKGRKILNRVFGGLWQKRKQFDPPPAFRPAPPIEPPPQKGGGSINYYVVGGTAEQKGRSRYRNPVIRQAASTDPRFNHKLRRA